MPAGEVVLTEAGRRCSLVSLICNMPFFVPSHRSFLKLALFVWEEDFMVTGFEL